jgi:hypothetical protein
MLKAEVAGRLIGRLLLLLLMLLMLTLPLQLCWQLWCPHHCLRRHRLCTSEGLMQPHTR